MEEKIESRTIELKKSNDELIKLNFNLEEYAHITSHDLQEPIRKIRTFNSLLLDEVKDNVPAQILVQKIESSATRMTNLIKDVLEYSEVSEKKVCFKEVNLQEILQQIEQDLELLILEKNVTILSKSIGTIQAVPAQIYQLFFNLIKNGIKFNQDTPVIKVMASEIEGREFMTYFDTDPERKYVKIQVKDNGIGIDKNDRPTLLNLLKDCILRGFTKEQE